MDAAGLLSKACRIFRCDASSGGVLKGLSIAPWGRCFKHAVKKRNSIYKEALPRIVPCCRRACCSSMVRKGMPMEKLKDTAGRFDIGATSNASMHLRFEGPQEAMKDLE